MGDFRRDDRGGGRDFGGGGRSFNRGGDRGGSRGDRPMFSTTCSNCGKACEVPFRPTGSKPIYCSDCFEKMGGGRRSESPRPERSDFRTQAPGSDQNKGQFESIHAKLDKVLRLLESCTPPVVPTVVPILVAEEVKEIKVSKIKPSSTKVVADVPEVKPDSAKASTGNKATKKPASKREKAADLV